MDELCAHHTGQSLLEVLARLGEEARAAASAASLGRLDPAKALLEPWSFASDEALCERVVRHLLATPPRPSPRALALAFSPPARPPSPRPAPIWAHREQLAPGDAPPPGQPGLNVAWALYEAALLGAELRQRQLAAGRRAGEARPEDGEARDLWLRMLSQDPWPARERWEELYFEPVRRAFALQFEERGLAMGRRRHIENDLRDAFFLVFLPERRSRQAPGPVLRELGVRVLEAGEDGPLIGLGRQLDARARLRLASCAVGREHARVTARLRWPEARRRSAVVSALANAIEADRGALAELSDLHVLVRLLECWSAPEYTMQAAIRRIVTQNRGRARGRLRALATDLPTPTLVDAVLGQQALHARTLTAMSRLGRDWAWQERQHDYTMNGMRALTAPCRAAASGPVELDPEVLTTWCLLVVLRGRLELLERWVLEGGTGSKEATFGRLLTIHMPPGLLLGTHRSRKFDALRAALRRSLEGLLVGLLPQLTRIAGLDPRQPGVVAQVHAVLAPAWAADIPLPLSNVASMIPHAQRACAIIKARPRTS